MTDTPLDWYIQELRSPNAAGARYAVKFLLVHYCNSRDLLREALVAVVAALHNPNPEIRKNVAIGIAAAASIGNPLRPLVPELRRALRDPVTCEHAANALATYFLNANLYPNWAAVENLFRNRNPLIRKGVAHAICQELADHLSSHSVTLPFLRRILRDPDLEVALAGQRAADSCVLRLPRGADYFLEDVVRLLSKSAVDPAYLFSTLFDSIAFLAQHSRSLRKLQKTEQVLEAFEREHCREHTVPAQLTLRIRITHVLQTIAGRKAELVRQKDGELLAGKTFRPGNRKERRIYRAVRMVYR